MCILFGHLLRDGESGSGVGDKWKTWSPYSDLTLFPLFSLSPIDQAQEVLASKGAHWLSLQESAPEAQSRVSQSGECT